MPRPSLPHSRNALQLKARDLRQPGLVMDMEAERPVDDEARSSQLDMDRQTAQPTRSELPSSFSLIKNSRPNSILHRSKVSVPRRSKAAGPQKVPKMIAEHMESRKLEASGLQSQLFEALTGAAARKPWPKVV